MSAVTVSIEPALPVLEREWRVLENAVERPFFLSWHFVGTGIELTNPPLYVARFHDGEALVGLAVLWPVTETRHGVFRIRQLRLNEFGASARDTVPSEYTMILAAPGYQERLWPALIETLLQRPDWDEFLVTNLLKADGHRLAASGLRLRHHAQSGSGLVDLDGLRAAGATDLDGYLATLGKSTRSAIARSIRIYAERGAVHLDRARDVQEALAWFDAIAKLQTAKWQARGAKGMEDYAYLGSFTRRLIERSVPDGAVELLRISAGGEAFAWLCNFVDRRKVLFNIGGFKVEDDNRLKPGLVAHAFAIADHLKAGMAVYDFMAGDDRYKTNLGKAGPYFVTVAVQRPRLILRIEDALRVAKHRLRPTPDKQPNDGAKA